MIATKIDAPTTTTVDLSAVDTQLIRRAAFHQAYLCGCEADKYLPAQFTRPLTREVMEQQRLFHYWKFEEHKALQAYDLLLGRTNSTSDYWMDVHQDRMDKLDALLAEVE